MYDINNIFIILLCLYLHLNVYINIIYFYLIYLVIFLPDPVYCPNNCGRRYKGLGRKGTLMRHLKNECGVPKQYQCPICQKQFARKDHLNNHCIGVHRLLLNK